MRYLAAVVLVVVAGACAKSSTTTSTTSAAPSGLPASAAPSASAMASTTVHTADSSLGKILVDSSGKTLYHFDKDSPTTIACTGSCADTWPPLLATGTPTGAEALGLIKRPEGTNQVTYKGMPVYRYAGDAKAGDTNGDGIGGVWHATKVS